MNNEKTSNVPVLSIGQIADRLSSLYCSFLRKGVPLKQMPSVMLWGAPGVGKSQGVREIADKIHRETGKAVRVSDVRLLLFNPIDLRGIPTSNAEKTRAIWLKPEIFDMDDSGNVVNILFLDEISAAPASIQAAAYQIVLDRKVGEHSLPDNCIVIAAGNRVSDKSVAYKMPKALANRLLHFEVESDFSSWERWAFAKGIDPRIIGFLSFRRDCLMGFDPSSDDLAFPTPRSWEMASNILGCINGSIDEAYPLLAGILGNGTAIEFRNWEKIYQSLPRIEDIFAGKCTQIPKGTDALYALVSSMAAFAKQHKDDMVLIGNSIGYARRLPADFSVVLLKNYLSIEGGYREKLLALPEFSRWLQEKGRFLNGIL